MRCGKAGVRPPRCSRRKASAHLADLALEELDEVARLVEADAIVFGSPTYMGGPAWQFKKFADATSKPWFVQLASLTPRAGYGVSTSRPTLACSLISRQPGTASSRAGASASRQLQETGALLHQRPATADAFDDAVEAFDLLLAEAVVLGSAEQLQPGPAGDGLALRLGLPAVVPVALSDQGLHQPRGAQRQQLPVLLRVRVAQATQGHYGGGYRV
ncbi:TPA: flavodoxin family protein [Pseudomonas aeruginosa]|nr:flavodoxin family protein [Pseudomonas aeruginosa]